MKQSLEGSKDASGQNVQKPETELAFQIADRFISIHETDEGYDYSIMGEDYKVIDGGVYDNPDVSIREALSDIVEDLKENPFDNGARGKIGDNDEQIPIDYNGLIEKVEAANRIEPQVEEYLEGVREAKEKEPISIFNIRMNDEKRWFKNTSRLDAEGLCKAYAECDKPFVEMGQYGEWIEAADYAYISQGDRLDFSIGFNEETDQITIFDGENFEYKGLRATLFPEQVETEVTLTVAECGEFHNLGGFHENIPTVDEAIAIWKQIPPERMNGIPAIGINIHTPGTETIDDVGIDILSGKHFDLDILEYIPEIKGSPQAMEVIAELMAKLPEMEIYGEMSQEMEEKVWEKRMPELTPAEQLAVELDRFYCDLDTYSYGDEVESMTENISRIEGLLEERDTGEIIECLNEIIDEGALPEQEERAKELLAKLTEYKPLTKIEEMEEQNFNMVDNVLNNGAGEKAQKEENKKDQESPAAKPSLKDRLAEKKELVSGQGKEHETQENLENSQREM